MEFVILRANVRGEIKTVLVDHDQYREEGFGPEGYFPPYALDPEEVGIVQVVGDIEHLGATYTED